MIHTFVSGDDPDMSVTYDDERQVLTYSKAGFGTVDSETEHLPDAIMALAGKALSRNGCKLAVISTYAEVNPDDPSQFFEGIGLSAQCTPPLAYHEGVIEMLGNFYFGAGEYDIVDLSENDDPQPTPTPVVCKLKPCVLGLTHEVDE